VPKIAQLWKIITQRQIVIRQQFFVKLMFEASLSHAFGHFRFDSFLYSKYWNLKKTKCKHQKMRKFYWNKIIFINIKKFGAIIPQNIIK